MPTKSKHKWKQISSSMPQLSPTFSKMQPPHSSHHHPKMKNKSKIRNIPVILINSFIATALIHSLFLVLHVPGSLADTDLFQPQGDININMDHMDSNVLLAEMQDFSPNWGPTHESTSSWNSSNSEIDEGDNSNSNRVPAGGNNTETSTFNPYANFSVDELMELEIDENPLRDPLSIAIPMSVIYSLILLSGLVGNVSTCIVIARTSYMHTATNYYLFSLAMSDLLLLISGLPQEIYHIWIKYPYIFGEAFCVIRGLAAETSANATVLTITAFTVERFVAIVYPLKSHKLSQLSRVVRMIGIIWVVAFCLALPQAAQFGVLDQMSRHRPDTILIKGAWCTLVREIFPYAFQISICVFFVIPMSIISVLYILIGLKLRRSRKGPLNPEPRLHSRHSQSHVVRMLIAVVCAFFCGWAPFHAQRLMALYGSAQKVHSDFFLMVYQGLTHVSGILYYLSTCVNPILYHIMSNKFRQAFKDTLGSICGRAPPPRGHHTRTYSAMSYSHRSLRMTHYTSQRINNTNSIIALNKNFTQKGGVNVSCVKVGESNLEKCPIDVDIAAGANASVESRGKPRRASSCSIINPINSTSNGNNGNSINSMNGMPIIVSNGLDTHNSITCSCPPPLPPQGASDKMLINKSPKITTTILSSSTSFVTQSHCPTCGGCTSKTSPTKNGRGVTFGFLGKVKNKSVVVNGLYKNRNGLLLDENNHHHHSRSSSNDDTKGSMTLINSSSPPEKDGLEIPMTDMKPKSNGKSHHSGPHLLLRLDTPKSKQKPSLKAFLRRKKDKPRDNSSLVLTSSGYCGANSTTQPYRLPSDSSSLTLPPLQTNYSTAVTILDSKGGNKTTLLQRERTGSSGNVGVGVIIPKNTCRATSYTSMDSAQSNNTNTISNSSLQSDIEGEYTSEELAGYMADLNLKLESPNHVLI